MDLKAYGMGAYGMVSSGSGTGTIEGIVNAV
jgi:hypothetical protein